MAVYALGWQSQVSSFFGPGGGLEEKARETVTKPVDKARESQAKQRIETLIRAAQFEAVGAENINTATLEAALLTAEPDTRIGQPIDIGGIELTVTDGDLAVFCAHPDDYFCSGTNLATRFRHAASGPKLAPLKRQVAAELR